MLRSRLVACLGALVVIVLPVLSAASPAPALGDGRSQVAPPDPPAWHGPFAAAVFNHPSKSTPTSNDWWDINDDETWLLNYGDYYPDQLIQVSLYRMVDRNMASALAQLANYGDTVQVLLDGSAETQGCHGVAGCVNKSFQILEYLNQINKTWPGRSATWFRTCAGYGPDNPTPFPGAGDGCLGQALNHNKFMLISNGEWDWKWLLHDVVLQTSSNDTNGQNNDAFNNALIIANRPTVYADYQRYFDRLAAAYQSAAPTSDQRFTARTGDTVDTTGLRGHDIETFSYPRAVSDDPLLDALRSVRTANRCANVPASAGGPAHTMISVGMFAIAGRSAALRDLDSLAGAGCRVDVVYTTITRRARRVLNRPRIRLQQLCTRQTAEQGTAVGQGRYYVHSKYLLIAGSVRGLGHNRRIIYTGSENLTTASLTSADNRDIRYVEAAGNDPIYTKYRTNLRQMQLLGASKRELGPRCDATDAD